MATYGDLKTRIVTQTHRDDLEDEFAIELRDHIADAIAYYATRPFWFNVAISEIATVADTATLASGVGSVSRIVGLYGDLQAMGLDRFAVTTDTGYPQKYTLINGVLRFWPVPDDAYDLTVYGTPVADNVTDDEDENVWTNEGQRLIAAHTKMTLYYDLFANTEAGLRAEREVQRELERIREETWRREDTRLTIRQSDAYGQPLVRRLGV